MWKLFQIAHKISQLLWTDTLIRFYSPGTSQKWRGTRKFSQQFSFQCIFHATFWVKAIYEQPWEKMNKSRKKEFPSDFDFNFGILTSWLKFANFIFSTSVKFHYLKYVGGSFR